MEEEDSSTYLANRIMGMIADRLRAQLADMKARHAETDRQLAEAREECYEALRQLDASAERLLQDS